MNNRCGCEFGDDCTKTTRCRVQSEVEDAEERIKELEAHLAACSDTCGFQARKIARLRDASKELVDALQQIANDGADPGQAVIADVALRRYRKEDTDND